MKANLEKSEPAFVPLKFEIIIESQDELDALGSLFNSGAVCAALSHEGFNPSGIWRKFRDAGAVINKPLVFALELRRS